MQFKTMSKIHPPSSKKEKDGMPYYIRRWKLVNQRCLAMIRKTCYVIDEFEKWKTACLAKKTGSVARVTDINKPHLPLLI
jgi:hypothetical protein